MFVERLEPEMIGVGARYQAISDHQVGEASASLAQSRGPLWSVRRPRTELLEQVVTVHSERKWEP
jgi:hypothetical protein